MSLKYASDGDTDFSLPPSDDGPAVPFESIDVLGTDEIVGGVILAVLLAFTASFLQGRRSQNDFVLWERKAEDSEGFESSKRNNTDRVVFDAESWQEMSQPDNYVLYQDRIRKSKERSSRPKTLSPSSVSNMDVEQRIVLVLLLVLFMPIFSVELFFALSRQAICNIDGTSIAPDWVNGLCSPYTGR